MKTSVRGLTVIITVLGVAAAANATIYAEMTGGPTPSDPAYDTFTVTLKSTDPTVYITG